MKECTLEQAVELCEKNGGRVKSENGIFDMSNTDLREMSFTVEEILLKWIYEAPKQSSFQEWDGEHPLIMFSGHTPAEFHRKGRKEGWNAAIDEVLKLKRNPARDLNDNNEIYPAVWCHQIEKLKED